MKGKDNMGVLKKESDDVNVKFKGQCPLCRSHVTFTVTERRMDLPFFFCPSCGAEWEYWEDHEKKLGMKAARLIKPGKNGEGREFLKVPLDVSRWLSIMGYGTPSETVELKGVEKPEKLVEKPPEEKPAAKGFEIKKLFESAKERPEPAEVAAELPQYSHYANNGFSLNYPSDWKVRESEDSIWSKGEVNFVSRRPIGVNVVWGLIDQAQSKYPSAWEYANAQVAKVKELKEVSDVKVIEQNKIEKENHDEVFTHLEGTTQTSSLFQKKKTQFKGRSIHIYCMKTRRYFTIYSQCSPEMSEEQEKIFKEFMNTFDCHAKI